MNFNNDVSALNLACVIPALFIITLIVGDIWGRYYPKFLAARITELSHTDKVLFVMKCDQKDVKHRELSETCAGRLDHLGENEYWLGRCTLVATSTRFIVYVPFRKLFSFTLDQIQWLIPPFMIWFSAVLHVETEDSWYVFQMSFVNIDPLVSLLKRHGAANKIAGFYRHIGPYRYGTDPLVLNLKRHGSTNKKIDTYQCHQRSYQYSDVLTAYPATQYLQNTWLLADPVNLYLMPRFLIILKQARVMRKIPLKAIHQVAVKRRLDTRNGQGLVFFNAENETFVFALKEYKNFAHILAEATQSRYEELLA
ncbi:MAG TPA: hypothetical protein VHO69_17150 [Phototrophicaceae bacterium]|nr:hypothetical protein [Phototrophicaceae bacterium]